MPVSKPQVVVPMSRLAAAKVKSTLVSAALGWSLIAAAPAPEPLFQLDGKSYTVKDLKVADQQAAYDIQLEAYQRLNTLAQQAALSVYFDAEAKKSGKPRSQVEADLISVAEPTDKQAADWFEANKARIPPGYTLDKVMGEVKGALREQGAREKREALLAKLKSEKKLVVLGVAPESPAVTVDTKDFPVLGDNKAPITVAEFADYQCPHCRGASTALHDLVKRHPGKVKVVFLDYPIKGEFSLLVAYGAYCAGQQGKFWPFHDLAYDKQTSLGTKDAALTLAKELKLDEAKFNSCMSSDAPKKQVERSKAEGDRLGLTGTPLIYMNGHKLKSYEAADLDKAVAQYQ